MEHTSATPATSSGAKKMWGAIGLNLLLLVGVGTLAKWNYNRNIETKWKEFASKKKS